MWHKILSLPCWQGQNYQIIVGVSRQKSIVSKELAFTVSYAFGCALFDALALLLANKPFHPQLLQDGFNTRSRV